MKKILLVPLTLFLLLTSGCVTTEVDLPNNGGRFKRTSFLSNQSIGKIDVRTPNATGVTIDSYGNNSTEVVEKARALADALARAAK